jgi:hypothetical protein
MSLLRRKDRMLDEYLLKYIRFPKKEKIMSKEAMYRGIQDLTALSKTISDMELDDYSKRKIMKFMEGEIDFIRYDLERKLGKEAYEIFDKEMKGK